MPKTFYQNTKNEKHTIKNKTNKIKKTKKTNKTKTKKQKKPRTSYCFGCKDFIHNFRPNEIKMTTHCVVFRSNKSRFLKQKIN